MNEIITSGQQMLPETIEDLTQFVLVGKAKLQAYMLKLRTVNKLSVAQEIRDQTLKEAQEISNAVIAAEQRIGELLLAIPKQAGGDRKSEDFKNGHNAKFEKTKKEVASDMGYSHNDVRDYTEVKRNYGLIDEMGRQKSYKKLKRKNFRGAMAIVESYVAPISIQNDVDAENELDMDE